MTTTPEQPSQRVREAIRQEVLPIIGACLLMRSDNPLLADPRTGVAAEVAKAMHARFERETLARTRAETDALREALALISGIRDLNAMSARQMRNIAERALAAGRQSV